MGYSLLNGDLYKDGYLAESDSESVRCLFNLLDGNLFSRKTSNSSSHRAGRLIHSVR